MTRSRPDVLTTVFAGQDLEATERARQYIVGYPPSSPAVALFKDQELVWMMERHQIEGSSPQQIAAKRGKKIKEITPLALQKLVGYEWPGNIREMENLMERAYILETSSILTPESFPSELFETMAALPPSQSDARAAGSVSVVSPTLAVPE